MEAGMLGGWLPGPRRDEEIAVTTMPERGTSTIVEERTELQQDAGDHDRFSHYVPRDKLMRALVEGTPVRALCGKLWTPSRDPNRYPVCPECKEIWESLPEGQDRSDAPA
jgi:hypothetical protein